MKKFLTVLLVIAVMFTFSFSSAFADISNDDANMIKQAADYVKSGLPESVQKAYKAVLAGGTANTYITEAAWDAAAADIVEDLGEKIDTAKEAYLAGGTISDSTWNKYDYVYAASKLYTGYDYVTLAGEFSKDNNDYAVAAAKQQFKIDLTDAMAVYDKVDLDSLYSKTEPADKSYYEQAAEAIATAKESLNKYFYDAKGNVINVNGTVSGLAGDINVAKSWITDGFAGNESLGVSAFKGVKAENYEGTTVAKYYYVVGIKTIDSVKVDEAINAAKTAAIKAQVAKNVALFLKDNTTSADKTFAENYTTLYNYLADEIPAVAKLSSDVVAHETMMNAVKGSHGTLIANAVDDIKALETYAAKYAAEKDATGALVRDVAEVNKLVAKAKLYTYSKAVGISDDSIPAYTISDAMIDIAAMTTAGDAAKLAFDKEAYKADLDDLLDGAIDNYYDLEAVQLKAAYEAAKAKVDAATDAKEFTAIKTALDKEVAKIANKGKVEGLFTSGKMAAELNKQATALNAYVTYQNTPVQGKPYEDTYVNLTTSNASTLLRDYYIENNVRTLAEMQALTGAVEAVAATLPTTGSLAAAKKAADDAIKALPSAAKVTSADKTAYQNAFDLANTYNDMVKTATGTTGTLAIAAGNINALQAAIQADFQLAYAKADKADKAALKAISADVTAANDEVGDDKLFTVKFTDPTTSALAKIRQAEKDAVIAAINAIPMNVTEADKATVQKARELYDAFVAEYTDYDLGKADGDKGYVAAEFAAYYHDLALAEASLGLNGATVESLKIKASSTKGKGWIKVTWKVNGDTSMVDGYQLYKSTKAQSGYKKCITTTKTSFKNTKNLKKGTRYYYKVRAYQVVNGKTLYSDWSNKANRVAI